MTESNGAEYEVFNLYNTRPIRVRLDEWPVVAAGSAGEVIKGKAIGVAFIVRLHADGRHLSEASYVDSDVQVANVALLTHEPGCGPYGIQKEDTALAYEINGICNQLLKTPGFWMNSDLIFKAKIAMFESMEPREA